MITICSSHFDVEKALIRASATHQVNSSVEKLEPVAKKWRRKIPRTKEGVFTEHWPLGAAVLGIMQLAQ